MFSWLHIRDLLNQQALVAPVVLTSLVWLALWRRWAQVRAAATPVDQATLRFVSVAALGHLLLITIWNPDYGGQRDWDLFSLHAVTTALWLAAYARQTLREDRLLLAGFVPLIALQAIQTAAFIYQNTLPWEWP